MELVLLLEKIFFCTAKIINLSNQLQQSFFLHLCVDLAFLLNFEDNIISCVVIDGVGPFVLDNFSLIP